MICPQPNQNQPTRNTSDPMATKGRQRRRAYRDMDFTKRTDPPAVMPNGGGELQIVIVQGHHGLCGQSYHGPSPINKRNLGTQFWLGQVSNFHAVIFAEEGETSLLGMVSLQEAALAADPLAGRLIPANLLRL